MSVTAQAQKTKTASFCWYELMTPDADAAEAFYRHVIGWSAKDAGMPDGKRYTLLSVGDTPVAGLMALPQEARDAGARPGWMGYIAVDDIDDHVARTTKAGGKVHRAAEDIPGVGRFAVMADPQGAIFVLFHGDGTPPAPLPFGTPGAIGWHELYAKDWHADFDFYSGLFGWTKADAIDMGPMGTYQLFAAGGAPLGGMMNLCDGGPAQVGWGYYFIVEAIDAAAKRATDKGAKVVHGPVPVPGDSWVVQCVDPQGAHFAMVASKR